MMYQPIRGHCSKTHFHTTLLVIGIYLLVSILSSLHIAFQMISLQKLYITWCLLMLLVPSPSSFVSLLFFFHCSTLG